MSLYYTVVLYTSKDNLNKLIEVNKKIKIRLQSLYSPSIFEINSRTIDGEEVNYFRFFDYVDGKAQCSSIINQMNQFTAGYGVRWALEVISNGYDDILGVYYLFDETKSFLDYKKVHIYCDGEDVHFSYFLSNVDEIREVLSLHLNDDDINTILTKIKFNERTSVCVNANNEYEDLIQVNSFEYIDNKYFYWNK